MKERERKAVMVEVARQRCEAVIDSIETLPASTNITDSCKRTLCKRARSELNFLSRACTASATAPLSVNIGHLEAVLHILQQPFITGVSRVCKPIPLPPEISNGKKDDLASKRVYVDIICTLNRKPVWIIVSDRNPRYISWHGCYGSKGIKSRIERVLSLAKSSMVLKPTSIILFFSYGLGNFVREKLQDVYGASEFGMEFSGFDFEFSEDVGSEWVNVLTRSYVEACVLEINLEDAVQGSDKVLSLSHELSENHTETNADHAFCSLISGLKKLSLNIKETEATKLENLQGKYDLINFDTTALIALVSGISNGGTEKLLATPESDLRQRFKGNFEFVMEQVKSEAENPILAELAAVISGKTGMVCESVHSEFKELVSMCGGLNEKVRAEKLLNSLTFVPDNPSERLMGLPTTRKLALKNKVIFGTGDYWHAPTLTANMAFVRAISQTGMSMPTIQHRPRALTGD